VGETVKLELFDTHAHLDSRRYEGELDEVVARARRAGVSRILTVGVDIPSARASLAIAERFEGVHAAVGVHPHAASDLDRDALRRLEEMSASPYCVAIGETGLDFYRDLSPRPAQREAFKRHIELALRTRLPLVVHDRDAHDEVLAILEREGACGVPVVMHCFSGGPDMARECIERGYFLSLAGPVTYPGADRLREVASLVPAERLMVETDAPYLAPQAHRGRRNEPAFVVETAKAVAAARCCAVEEVASGSTAAAVSALLGDAQARASGGLERRV